MTTSCADGVWTLTLDSPANRNALGSHLLGDLSRSIDRIEQDPEARAVVMAATGSVFCAGADVGEQIGASPNAVSISFGEVLERLWRLEVPVVGAVTGGARGGGLGLIATCDIAIADHDALFGFSEVRLGVAPAIISRFVLARMHPRVAVELFLTGETFDGRQAAEIGLVTRAVAAPDVRSEVERVVLALLCGGPAAVRLCKRLPRLAPTSDLDELERLSAETFASPEGQEGLRAFREKRRPTWIPERVARPDDLWPRPARWTGRLA